MVNDCDEKFRLAEDYQLATTRFSEAVKNEFVLAVDDHPLLRDGIAGTDRQSARYAIGGEAASGVEAVEKIRATQPNATLMDLRCRR
jgi:hypothetical protein